ncbi:MAG: hypothetical protein KJ734_07615, partial [Chloroflexi bacterium]|nr:hypothetical protein [Chloroflexota bacterium]
VNGRLQRALVGSIPAPRVTVQPNFEVYVESECYPADLLAQLTPLTEVVSEGLTTVLRLQKERVAAQLAQDEGLDVAALLTRLTGQELPQNVAWDLAAWSRHAEKFTLYRGFALLEGDEDLPAADPFTVERISPAVRLVHSPDQLLARLESAELVPLRVQHGAAATSPLPALARTMFPQQSVLAKPQPREKELVVLRRHTSVTLHVPNGKMLERLRRALLEIRCPVEVNKDLYTITYTGRYEPQVMQVIKALEKTYRVQVEDIE